MNRFDLKQIINDDGIKALDLHLADYRYSESVPFSKNISLYEACRNVVPDEEGFWANPVYYAKSFYRSDIGLSEVARLTKEYLEKKSSTYKMDIISIMSGIESDYICSIFVVRIYGLQRGVWPYFEDIVDYIDSGDNGERKIGDIRFVYPDDAFNDYTEEDIYYHERKWEEQRRLYEMASEETPFLNMIDEYVPEKLYAIKPNVSPIYDLMTKDKKTPTKTGYSDFVSVFQQCMRFVTSVEQDGYYSVIQGKRDKSDFMNMLEAHIEKKFIDTGSLKIEDKNIMLGKLEKALFQMYIIQDLINDQDITDIKITSPDSIRVRIEGKAYLSNITFIDDEDYFRFVNSIAIKNGIDLSVPKQTFTDEHDENYILRFSITSPYITTGYPVVHVRKVARKKLMAPDLIKLGFFDEKIRDYLIDCGKNSRGVVFAGPPGSGKTVALNWFLEDGYEDSAEILVIQETDELFCYRKGVILEHVVNNPIDDEKKCTLEDLGQMALVSGANVFVIGEAKGSEICSAITLSNSGCRTAITIHSPSATETLDKMADLAMRGYASSYEQAYRMLKSFQTIVYLQDFKVQEITEIEGYDEMSKRMKYKYIYRRV